MKRIVLLLLCLASLSVQAQQSDAIDDVLQHVPMASVLALRVAGVDGQSAGWGALALTAVASYGVSAGVTYSLKHLVSERRPDGTDRRSFPSGHATFAFAGATVLAHEYGRVSPWMAVGGYAVATLVAADRVRRDRHYVHDVLAGAAVGFAATELTYYINKRFVRARNVDVALSPTSVALAVRW